MAQKKYDSNLVLTALQKNLETPLVRRIMEEINLQAAQKDEKEGGEKEPPVKKQFAILISDPEGKFRGQDYVGWVLQIPEDESPVTIMDRVGRSVDAFNNTKKGRLNPVKTTGEAFECIAGKIFTESMLWVKTKIPVLVVTNDGTIPKNQSE